MIRTVHFYLSDILGKKILGNEGDSLGILTDIIVDLNPVRPKAIAAVVRKKRGGGTFYLDFSRFSLQGNKDDFPLEIRCDAPVELQNVPENALPIAKFVFDKQIIDVNGKQVVRVNDLRFTVIPSGTYLIAVDVGMAGLLRRLGVEALADKVAALFRKELATTLISWENVEAINLTHLGLTLAHPSSKLEKLHPSDLADIIEDLDRKTQVTLFASLDDERAADVLEELETTAQKNVLENLDVERAADVLDKMPADEVADILDDLQKEKTDELLGEMEAETSTEVRELMEYPENEVGSLMSTDYISFVEEMTVEQTINALRKMKPESDMIYYLYVMDSANRLVATVSLRDLIVSEPATKLKEIMNSAIVFVGDKDNLNSLVEIISKYSLLALPVVDRDQKMVGMVIIDDVVRTLLKIKRRV